MPVTREVLDQLMRRGCSVPNCGHKHDEDPLWIHGQCHLHARTGVAYFDGVLTICCDECGGHIASVQVARAAPREERLEEALKQALTGTRCLMTDHRPQVCPCGFCEALRAALK